MVSTSEGVVYYCTVLLTALVFLTEASAITTNYEKSTAQNKTQDSSTHDVSPQRTKLTPTRGRHGGLSKNQNHDRVGPPLVLHKLKSHGAAKIESSVARDTPHGELLMPSNSGGENEIKDKGGGSSSTADDDDQKTLSQQVADGKYGLIQDEIFTAKPQRPGVLSYDVNPEVPKDNINNLGGLEPDDIWLAENHLLVLAGGALNSMQSQWTPIDNYVAPKRPVRLPPNPKVPPPFPVQLSENGPIEFLKSDRQAQPLGFLNPLLNQYQNFNKTGYGPSMYGQLPFGQPVGGQPPIKPLRPSLPINSNAAPPSPIFVKPPPGSEFIPPYLGAANQSEAFDEDDPSLYYPPPYDFYYPKDNTSKVPPGPLVPGIVLPPPPDFFTLLTNRTKSKDSSAPTATKEKPFKSYTYKAGKQLQYDNSSPTGPSSTTSHPLEPTTFVTYDDIINDVTYPDTHDDDKITYSNIKVNKVSTEELGDGWIPIPAPKPFYITGPKKPLKPTLLVMMETPPDGNAYNRPATAFKSPHKMPSLKFLHYVDKPADDFPPTTPLTSQLVSTPLPTSAFDGSTTPSTPYQSPPPAAIKATYYFYEEPHFVDVDNSKPPSPSYSTSSPPLPAKPLGEYDGSKTAAARPKPEKKRKPITPMIPIYYLAELQNIVDLVKPINLPHPHQSHLPQSTPKTQYYTTTAKPTYTINKPNYERPTSKPILEYSFVASDYNSPANPPPVTSTPSPPSYNPAPYQIDYNAYYQQQPPQYPALSHYPVYNSVPQYNKPVHTTATPILFLSHQYGLPPAKPPQYDFERPWLQQHLGTPLNAYNVPISSYPNPTENPYYAFFTKEEEDLIDDNTKKYFTIFGQKIKHSVEATTPLPPAETVAPTSGQRWSTQYAGYANYPSQSPPSSTGAAGAYDSYGSTTASTYQQPSSTSKPLSLEGDTRVNYVTPLPAVDADAEYVSHKLSKHIRPIVVEDLPADVNERLKNIINLQDRRKTPPAAGSASGTRVNHKYRYTLIDDADFDGARLPYPSNLIDNYGSGNRFADTYSGQGTSTPHSLEGDVRVNYNQPQKLTTDADAEYIENSSEYRESSKEDEDERHRGQESRTSKPHSLANDILVNYKGRYPADPDAEYIDSGGGGGGGRGGRRGNANRGGGGGNDGRSSSNIISYKYPGVEHGHFYFLTPQETHLSQIEDERYDFQSDVEKPSSYFKRVPRQRDQSTPTTTRTA